MPINDPITLKTYARTTDPLKLPTLIDVQLKYGQSDQMRNAIDAALRGKFPSDRRGQAKAFIEKVMNERDAEGKLSICIPGQVLMEFLNVITRHQLESPLSLHDAAQLVQDYVDTGVTILYPKSTQLSTLLDLLKSVTTRQKVFDVALVATLKDHGIS